MSLMADVQKFIEENPGCTSSDIANAFEGYPRRCVLQTASKLRQSGRVAHRYEGETHRHYALHEEPTAATKPVRDCYTGTNDPRVILRMTRKAEELESKGLYRRAATVWMEVFCECHSPQDRNKFLQCRERCLRKSKKFVASGDGWYLSGNYVGLNDDVNTMPAAGAGYADFLP
ncbi:UNVERIFIED_ORG: PerC transcriptional activator [Citrobacter freundii]